MYLDDKGTFAIRNAIWLKPLHLPCLQDIDDTVYLNFELLTQTRKHLDFDEILTCSCARL